MFAIMLLLILFAILLVGVCSFYFAGLIRAYLGDERLSVFEKKAVAAIEAADLGWVAIVSGPLVGVFLGSVVMPVEDWMNPIRVAPVGYGKTLLLTICVSAVAGVILGAAFWTTSAILGKVRNWEKKLGTATDPDFDGPV